MSSWRDVASPQAQDDLDELLKPALAFDQQQLGKHGEFYPYAVVVDHDGQQRVAAADTGQEYPSSADLIRGLVRSLSEQRNNLRAAAIVADVHVAEIGSDAIRVTLEHCERVALSVLLPYRLRRIGRGVVYGDPRLVPTEALIWPTD
jgi:hypothetical protein